MAQAKKLKINSSHRRDHLIVIITCLRAVRLRSVRKMGSFLINIYMFEKIVIHKIIVALVIISGQPLVFIQINRSNLGEVQIPFIIPFHKLLIGPDRRGTGSKPQYTIRLDNNLCGNNICRFPAHVHIILSFNNFHFYCSFSMYLVYTFPLYYKLLYSQSPDCSMYNPVFF